MLKAATQISRPTRRGARLLFLLLAWGPASASEPVGSNSFGFDYASYPFSNQPSRETVFPSFTGRFHGEAVGDYFEAVGMLELQFTYRPNASASFFEAPEAYVGTADRFPVSLKLGRKLEHWSHLDEIWQMGIWQPRFRWDYIRPEDTGLVGAFIDVETPGFKFVGFGSPGFIPERGVPMSFENGSITSSSIWFIPPPSKVTILDTATPVSYGLDVPPVKDVVMHAGASFLARLGADEGPWFQAGYAYKPMNQLLLAYDGYLQLNSSTAIATVHPRVLYQELISAEAGYTDSRFRGFVSALSDRPIRDQTPIKWTTQEVSKALSISPTVDYRVGGTRESPTVVGASYLRVWGGNAPDGGLYSSGGSGSVFDTRYPYANAMTFSLQGGLNFFGGIGNQMLGSARLLQDFGHQGSILSLEFAYRPTQKWVIATGADILGSDTSSDVLSAGSNFINRYQSNDRVHLGVSHVF